MKDVIIIGGGISGLICAQLLAKAGLDVCLVEQKHYPFHKVCGEYISNEVVPFLKSIDLYPEEFNPSSIQRLQISAPSGRVVELPLHTGGFGISRFAFDYFLYEKAVASGASIYPGQKVVATKFKNDVFKVKLASGKILSSKIAIGAYGKRSVVDKKLKRTFYDKPSPYIAVKYHIRTDFPQDMIALHNFRKGYCGISKVEGDRYCLCYLSHKHNLTNAGCIDKMEKDILSRNPFLEKIFSQSEFLYRKPRVISQVSFRKKRSVESHMLMIGDSAGMITPLCGNGIAMGIHSAALLTQYLVAYFNKDVSRDMLEADYTYQHNKLFGMRLQAGRLLQNLFGHSLVSELAVFSVNLMKPVGQYLVGKTHGKPFELVVKEVKHYKETDHTS